MGYRSSLTALQATLIVIIVLVAAVGGYVAYSRTYKAHRETAQTTTPRSVSSTTTTTSSAQPRPNLTLSSVYELNSSWVLSIGPSNASKVIVIVYDPECPFCALELNATLPFLYYISYNTSQARVVFLGLPIHEFSEEMLEDLYEIYNRYGPLAFLEVLDENYAYYTYYLNLYFEGEISQPVAPTNSTLIEMADSLGYNITQAESQQWRDAVVGVANFLLAHNITATPTILAYNSTGYPVYYDIGLIQPEYLVGNLSERLGLRVP